MLKKLIAVFLILTMVLGSGAFAFAADGDLWETEGPMHLWTEAQWNAAAGWTDEQMYEYYDGYQETMDAMSWEEWEVFWDEEAAAQESWTDEQWDLSWLISETYWELDEILGLIKEKEELGFPYPEGINVSVDGEFLTFPDARPALIDGRTMVPFRAIFEALDTAVEYDAEARTATATAENGDVVVLTLESKLIAITRADGSEEELEMDTVPYLDAAQGRIFVPVRFVSEALGCDVFWNAYYQLAIIVDKEALIAEIDGKFTLLNRLLQSQLEQTTLPVTTTEEVTLTGVLYGDTKDTNVSVSANSAMQIDGDSMAGRIAVDFDISQLKALFGEEFLEETLGLELPEWLEKGGDVNFIYNDETGEAFLNSALLNPDKSKNTWIRYEAEPEVTEGPFSMLSLLIGEDASVISEGAFTIGSLLYEAEASNFDFEDYSYSSYYASQYLDLVANLRSNVAVLDLFVGDAAFKTTANGTVSTHTMAMDEKSLPGDAVLRGLGADLIDLFYGLESGLPEFDLRLVIKEDSGKLLGMDLEGNVKIKGFFPVEISFSAKGDNSKSTSRIECTGAYLGKLLLETVSTTAPATKPIPTAPPANAVIEDYEDPWTDEYDDWDDLYPEQESEPEPEPSEAAGL